MKRLVIVLLLLLAGCSLDEPDTHGDLLFTMNCVWTPESEGDFASDWICQSLVDNEFVSGFLVLALMKDTDQLAFCGENLVTHTGDELYDALAAAFTKDQFKCMKFSENVSNNEFDWLWVNSDNQLSMIWRPADKPQKHVTLIIDDGPPNDVVQGDVFYLEVNPD